MIRKNEFKDACQNNNRLVRYIRENCSRFSKKEIVILCDIFLKLSIKYAISSFDMIEMFLSVEDNYDMDNKDRVDMYDIFYHRDDFMVVKNRFSLTLLRKIIKACVAYFASLNLPMSELFDCYEKMNRK